MKVVKVNNKEYPLTWRPGSDRYLGRLMGHTKISETQEALKSLGVIISSEENQSKEVSDLEWEQVNQLASIVLAAIYTGVKVEQRAGKDIQFDLELDDVYDAMVTNPSMIADVVVEMSDGSAPTEENEKKKED